ncbi:hypothetical protein FCV25MIE_09834 [Fagus crenata]
MDFELVVVGLRWWRFVKMGFELVVVGLWGEKGTTMGGGLWVSWFWFDSTSQSYKRVDSISTQAGKFSRCHDQSAKAEGLQRFIALQLNLKSESSQDSFEQTDSAKKT